MLFDPAHLFQRLLDPFNSESRFYWPAVVAILVGIGLNILWYYYRPRSDDQSEEERPSRAENDLRAWAVWANLITLIWSLVLIAAKVPFLVMAISFAIDIGVLVYLYAYWLPPRHADWIRELRRQRYIPRPSRRRR